MIETVHAVMSLRPGTEFVMNGDDVENIIWHTPNVEPLTQAEVEAEIQRLEQEQIAAEQAKVEKKQSAIAKLSALGLDEDEIAALMGGM